MHVPFYASYVACPKRHCPDHHDPRKYSQPVIWAIRVGFRSLRFARTGAGSSGRA